MIERPFSDLLRRPKEVTNDVANGDVVLRRRDEPDLRLTLAERDLDKADALSALGRTLRNLAVHQLPALKKAMSDAFSWVEFLPADDRTEFAQDFSRVLVASAELDSYAALTELIRDWKATAEVYADPKLARRLKRPITAAGPSVPPPVGR